MNTRIITLVILAALISAFFYFDLSSYLTLEYIKSQQAVLDAEVSSNPLRAATIYFVIYVLVAALSLPGAAIMTLLGGAIFGLGWGLLIISFASTIGATIAMLVSRFIFRDQVRARFGNQLGPIDRGIEKDGAFYLFTLRLVPIFPFFLVNLLMGVTAISAPVFFIVSQIGMLAGTAVFVNAGTQLAQIESLSGILSPGLFFSFALLGIFPLIAKKIVEVGKANRVLRGYKKPAHFDRDVVVIGAGSGGLVASLIIATVKGSVTLIEKNKMGGDCLNTGCVPSKSIIRSAKLAADMKSGSALGMKDMTPDFEFKDIMQRVHSIIKTIEPHDSVERYESLGVNCEMGEAKILSPYEVEVNGKIITTKNIIIAAGASPLVPNIDGIEEIDYLTSDSLWEIETQPNRLVVLGGGPIGSEMTQAFARLGSQVTQIEAYDRILSREDPEISAMMTKKFISEGIDVRLSTRAVAVRQQEGRKFLVVETQSGKEEIEFDELLVAVGRKANVTDYGLEALGVEISPRGTVAVDEYLKTNFPNIYAIGDVAGPYQFTHTASHMAWFAAVNALFGSFKKFKVDYSVVPWATFTSPEVARVGLNETEATEQGIDFEVTNYDISGLDRALADQTANGVVKVITPRGKDKILGVTIVADHAGDVLSEYVLAMKHGLGLGKIMGTIHIYPTLSEMNKFAASEWRKAHKPEWALNLSEKLLRFLRN
ncbi:MAG: FAD-dependent oxidoreductase [Pseudomonadales bacterium]|nr:FAD-dependent oxidoreductase [Pseudomonadales bacterium]